MNASARRKIPKCVPETGPSSAPSANIRIFASFVLFCASYGPIRLSPTFEMFLVETKPNDAAPTALNNCLLMSYPRASLRCALGYHITVPSGLADSQVQENYETKPPGFVK